jgi:sugar phosphate isomerase/epimerase
MNQFIKKKPVKIISNRRILLFTILCFQISTYNITFAQKPETGDKKSNLILSVNAYSFNELLSARDKTNNEQVYTLFDLLDWCASKKIKAIDVTCYYFPTYPDVPTDDYIKNLREKATKSGIAISGTGIRNDFASPDPEVRAAGVKLAKDWIIVASKLHAPVIRLFAGPVPKGYEEKWDEVAAWMIECFKECAAFGKQYGVKIGIQNHGDMLQTAEQCIKVLRGIDSDWAGLIVDTGSFRTADPYHDIELAAPYAINWQVKESLSVAGSIEKTDLVRLISIIRKKGYEGFLPVETLLVKGRTYDPFTCVTEMIQGLKEAIARNY